MTNYFLNKDNPIQNRINKAFSKLNKEQTYKDPKYHLIIIGWHCGHDITYLSCVITNFILSITNPAMQYPAEVQTQYTQWKSARDLGLKVFKTPVTVMQNKPGPIGDV